MAMTQAGKLRHRVLIQAPITANNPFATPVGPAWRDVVTMWAQIKPISGNELYKQQLQTMRISHTITIRYPGAQFQVGAGYRLLYGNRVFQLQQGILNPDERNITLILYAWETDPLQGGNNDGSQQYMPCGGN